MLRSIVHYDTSILPSFVIDTSVIDSLYRWWLADDRARLERGYCWYGRINGDSGLRVETITIPIGQQQWPDSVNFSCPVVSGFVGSVHSHIGPNRRHQPGSKDVRAAWRHTSSILSGVMSDATQTPAGEPLVRMFIWFVDGRFIAGWLHYPRWSEEESR